MKTLLEKFSKRKMALLLFPVLGCLGFVSCSENIDDSNLYTFKGETITDCLKKDTAQFGNFYYILKRVKLDQLLSAYGTYTCFAPTNEAVMEYIDSLYDDTTNKIEHNGMTSRSLAGLSDSLCNDIAKFHIAYTEVLMVDMNSGLTINTMLGRDLNASIDSNGVTCINSYSHIISADHKMENGVLHEINHVLRRSNRLVSGEMERHKEFSLFYKALEYTGLADSLSLQSKTGIDEVSNNDKKYWVPEECKVGYTVFAETDDVMKANNINNIDDLINYANEQYRSSATTSGWYDYYRDNGITVSTGDDYKNSNNALNMYVRYHILRYAVSKNHLTYGGWSSKDKTKYNEVENAPIFEYCETMLPYTLFKVENVNDGGEYFINRYKTNNTLTNQIGRMGSNAISILEKEGIAVDNGTDGYQAFNGYIHTLNGMLVYDKDVPQKVLNERIRFDVCSRLWELMSNSQRGMSVSEILPHVNSESARGRIRYPDNYFRNLVVYNGDETKLIYSPGHPDWLNYQADEFDAAESFDFAYRLPPVPDGTYELRMGYTANGSRGMVQFYIGDSPDLSSMTPIGIPIDMRATGDESFIGWSDCTKEDDYGFQTDKEMRNRGYMRGAMSVAVNYGSSNYTNCTNARELNVWGSRGLRLLIDKRYFKQGACWIRFKSVLPTDKSFIMYLDYWELCPVNVYNSTNYFEDMW